MIRLEKCYVDLHAHIDGSITPEIAIQLAKEQSILIQSDKEELRKIMSVPKTCGNLNDFLKCFEFPLTLLQSKEGLSEAVRLILENMKKDKVIYSELRFAPQLHQRRGMTQEDAVKAALSGLKKSEIPANLILCLMRGNDNEEKNSETLNLAEKYLVDDGGVTAIDLAGAEGIYPTENFKEIFNRARKRKIPFTIHAGEADGPESVRSAIDMGALRVGHGISAYKDEELMKEIEDRGIFMEMCPTSNFITGSVKNAKSYPARTFIDKGIKVTVNTDDMAIIGTTNSQEFECFAKLANLNFDEQKQVLLDSADAAFTTSKTKNILKEQINRHF